MKLQTAQLGEIEIDQEDIVVFPRGIPGFDHLTRFVLLHPEELSPFSIMQSVEDRDICFIITNPFLYKKDYDFELPGPVQDELGIKEEKDVAVWSIVTIPGKLEEATLNLQAPVVLNQVRKLGKQVILHEGPYTSKHRLF